MATVGTRLKVPFTVGTGVIVGQGDTPEAWVLYSVSDANNVRPSWSTAPPLNLRSASTRRGRASELDTVNAGTATIVLNNRGRAYDPISSPELRPMNRWWIREQFTGVTRDVFKGYAESYELQYPSKGMDAVTVVSCVDEFKVLATYKLPTTSPPRDSYQDVVMFDNPAGYWPMDEINPGAAVVGEAMYAVNLTGVLADAEGSAIIGQPLPRGTYAGSTAYMTTPPLSPGQSGDAGSLTEFSVEFMFKCYGDWPTTTEYLVAGPSTVGPLSTWSVRLDTTGHIIVEARNSGGTNYTVTSTTAVEKFQQAYNVGYEAGWHHIVGAITGGFLRLYIDGVQEASTAWTGAFATITEGSSAADTYGVVVGNGGATTNGGRYFDELAFYRYGLTAARVTDHYTAARLRGFPYLQLPGARITALLDHIGSLAPRAIRAGTRTMTGAYMVGQDVIGEMRKAEDAELTDAILFISGGGAITFLDNDHRSASPWNTVQATFDDDGTDLQYDDVQFDYSEAFLANEVKVTRVMGLTSTASDATSIARYGKRSKAIEELPITSAASQTTIAAAMLAKYKDPLVRITALTLNTGKPAVTEAVFNLDIGSRIRVFRRPLGGGTAIDQTLFLQSISVELRRNGIWTITLGVSPL